MQVHFSCRYPIVLSLRTRFLRAAVAFGVAGLLAVAPVRAAEPVPFTAAQLDQMLALQKAADEALAAKLKAAQEALAALEAAQDAARRAAAEKQAFSEAYERK